MKPKKIFYFAATHWDREWYKTVDEYRYVLVPVMDKIIDTLKKDPDFKLFTLDGQTSILEDYLTVRGESGYEENLRALIKSERLLIGPWYTMPDEFLLSGESIIQNLLYGYSICERYQAEPLKTGYVCDTFGHIANFPQLLNGFHIKNSVISRGTNDSDLECFFRWSSPDGSEVLTFKAPEVCGYGSFFFEVMSEFAPDYQSHPDEITQKAIQYVERELTRTSLPYVLLMDGMDHETIHEFMPEILTRLSEHFGCPVVQERLDDIFAEVNAEMNNTAYDQGSGKASSVTGELAALAKDYEMHIKLIPHTLSSRYDLKIANDRCQNLLEHYAMPSSAIDEINGSAYLYNYIRYAYSMLLQNHAHDSICGCSIDAVHREMQTRFAKTYNTAAEYFFQFCAKEYFRCVKAADKTSAQAEPPTAAKTVSTAEPMTVAQAVPSAAAGTEPQAETLVPRDVTTPVCMVKVFNPLPYEYEGTIEFDIDFDQNFEVQSLPYMKYEQRNSFLIYDEEGKELKYNIISASRKKNVKQFGGNKRLADTHRVAVLSKLKPLGFTTFVVKPSPLPYRITDRFTNSPVSCDNDFIRFEIASNGTITITDKKTGHIYYGLHSFLDYGEMGDGWFHIRPISDRSISSLGSRVSIEKTFDGYAECKFLVRYELELPEEKVKSLDFVKRSETYRTCIIQSEFTIARNSALVSVHTVIDNNIRDHRLVLHLPTGIKSDSCQVNQCNLILSRSTGLDNSHYNWKEHDITEQQFESMAFIRSEEGTSPQGLMFLSKRGLHEVSCPGDKENSIDITLLRCFNKTVNTDGEPDGELQGKQEFDYAILPISGETDCELVRIKDQYVCGYKEFTIPSGAMLTSESAFTFTSDACAYITSMPTKKSSGIIIRAANYSGKSATLLLHFTREVTGASLCNFLEEETGTAVVDKHDVSVTVPPYKMVNIKITFA